MVSGPKEMKVVIMTSNVKIIDDDYILDTDTYTIGLKSDKKINKSSSIDFDKINDELDRLENAIEDLESSLDPRTTSRISCDNREGIYLNEGLITNIIIGVILALILIILII